MFFRMIVMFGLLVAGLGMMGCDRSAADTGCDAVVGRWAWFVGGEVDVTRDGQFTQQSGNSGTWECSDPARGEVTFRWRAGGFVNRMVVSADGASLASADPAQAFVTAQRVSDNVAADSTPAPMPAPTTAESNGATSDRAKNIIELVRRIDAQYAGSQSSLSTSVFRGQSATLEPGFVLTLRDLKCDGDGNPRYKDLQFEIASALRTTLLTQLAADCDAKRDGLAWQPNAKRLEFRKMRYPKFEVSKRTDGNLGTSSVKLTTLQRGVEGFRPDDVVESIITIQCKDQGGCEQMARDLDALVDAIGVPRGTYERPE